MNFYFDDYDDPEAHEVDVINVFLNTGWWLKCRTHPASHPQTRRGKQYWAKQRRARWGKGARKR